MTAQVFVCYRRDDSAAFAGRVQDRLAQEFGRDLLFMDVDAIPLGVNFVTALHEAVAKCEVLLAVIGPNWLEARDDSGARRLDDPNDFVRIEIAAALQRDIPVIPILLDGARVPKADELPRDLGELSMRNGLDVRHASFHNDIDRLVRNLRGQLGEAETEERRRDGDERRPARPAEDTAEWQRLQEEENNRLQELEKTKEKRGRVERWLLPLIGAGAAFLPTFLITASEPSIALTTGMLSILYGGIAGMLVRNRVDILKAVAIPIIPAFLLLYSLNPAHIPSDVDTLRFAAIILGSGASCVWLALWLYSTWPRKQQKGSMRAL
jgi:TIR domain